MSGEIDSQTKKEVEIQTEIRQDFWYSIIMYVLLKIGIKDNPSNKSRVKRYIFLAKQTVLLLIPFLCSLGVIASVVKYNNLKFTNPLLIIKALFVIIASILPATMYSAFISRGIYSTLDDFIIKMDRLCLLKQKDANSHLNIRPIRFYLQRFEDLYGYIPGTIKEKYENGTSKVDISVRIYEEISLFDTILVSLATIFITIGWLLILFPSQPLQENVIGNSTSLQLIGTPVVNFAFLGAYLFSIEVLCRRYTSKDLRAIAFAIVSKRILVAVILVSIISLILTEETTTASLYNYSINNISNQSFNISITVPSETNTFPYFLYLIAFVIGFFPEVAWEYIKKRVTPVVIPSLKKDLPLSDLDGITFWDESRLQEEDIEDMPQMATADIVDLFLDTKIPSDRIIDWVDQAILYKCLATEDASNSLKAKLQVKGIRTASSFIKNYRELLKDQNFDKQSIKYIMRSLATYSNLKLVLNWKKMGGICEELCKELKKDVPY